MSSPFIRVVELVVGPLKEFEAAPSGANAVKIRGDGSFAGLRIQFAVKKSLVQLPNQTQVKIYNLSKELRAAIQKSLTRVQVYVGYENTGLSLLSQGGVLSSVSERSGADIVTTVTILDGYSATSQAITNMTASGSQPVSSLISDLAKQLPGVTVGEINVQGDVGGKGRSISSPTSAALDDLSTEYGFSWSIQDGVFQAIDDSGYGSGTGVVLGSPSKNLISAAPVLSGPNQMQTGVKIKAIIDPSVKVGYPVKLNSSINPDLNGIYKAHTIAYSGDTHADTWEMDLEAYLPFMGVK